MIHDKYAAYCSCESCLENPYRGNTCAKCGQPKEESRTFSRLCRACDHGGNSNEPPDFDASKVHRFYDARDANGELYLASEQTELDSLSTKGDEWVLASELDSLIAQNAALAQKVVEMDKIKSVLSAYNYAGNTHSQVLHMEEDMLQAKRKVAELEEELEKGYGWGV